MAWTLTGDADEYLAAAGPFLEADPVRHTVQLTVARAISADRRAAGGVTRPAQAPAADGPLFGWWQAAGAAQVSCAMMHTPPYSVLVTGLTEDAARSLAADLADRDRRPAAVAGERAAAGSFAAAWGSLTGQTAAQSDSIRLYRLASLTPARPAPAGSARVAVAADRGLIVDWFAAFHAEAGTTEASDPDPQLSRGCLTLWERDGQPVSVAGVRPPAAGVVRIGPVYTPPALRGHGYGGAATAAVSQAALDQGHQVVLFADLANPTSNALYQRLGFVPVEDRIGLTFHGASALPADQRAEPGPVRHSRG